MLPGKKAFDRLQWAFKNVLSASLAWLFYDLRSPNLTLPTGEAVPIALSAHAPTIKTIKPLRNHLQNALVPSFSSNEDSDDETELLEWLSLAMAQSPRVLSGDNLDSYLCRYRPDHDTCKPTDLVLYQWNGFAPSHFVQKIVLAAMKATVGDRWFALGAGAFSGDGYVILRDGGDVRTWRFSD
jgi:ribonuclease P/MRP protein subunit RPP40